MADTHDPEIEFNIRHQRDENENNAQEDREADETYEEGDNHEGGGDTPAAQGVRLSKAGLPVKPDTYDGTNDWDEYLTHFELCSELGRWQENEKTLALAASLRGPARTFYISLPQRDRRLYTDLVQRLSNRFGSTRQRSKWLSKFESRTRKSGESIAELGDDLRQMSQKAYPNLDCVAQEALAVNQLYKSITLEMKCRCIDRNCTTVGQAVDIIERYEAVLGEPNDKKKMARVVEKKTTNDDALGETLSKLNVRLGQLEAKLNTNPWTGGRQTNYQRGACFLCGSLDHYQRDCPRNWNNANQQQRQNQTQNKSGNLRPSSRQ